jgi:hypothetical protein
MKQWVDCGAFWAGNEQPFLLLDIQMLGHGESPLLGFEGVLAELLKDENQSENTSIFMTQCMALSIYWMFGLYEVLRKLKNLHSAEHFSPITSLFDDVEIVKMPLAKHEVKSSPGCRNQFHYPTPIRETGTGRVGWSVFDPRTKAMTTVYRPDFAERFLSSVFRE